MKNFGSRPVTSRVQWLKRLAQRDKDRVGFALSGGGPLGALQVGALKALFDHGVQPDLVVGTSVGALNAACLAFEPSAAGVERLEALWRGLRDDDLFPGSHFMQTWGRMVRRGDRLFDDSGLRRLIQTALGSDALFEDARIPFGAVVTDLETGAEQVITSGPVLEPLLASSAMPGAFPPVEIDGRRYIDGGVVNNLPITPALEMGASTVYALDSTGHSHQRRPLNRPMDYLMHAFSLARSQRLVIERRMFDSDRTKVVLIPTVPLDFFVPFTSMAHTETLIARSYEHTSRFLEAADSHEDEPARRLEAKTRG
ncbi:MAG: patatin-like phospholipase family protein [Actinomycetota bacterium]